MLGQAHTPWRRRRGLLLAVVALAVLTVPAVVDAYSSHSISSLHARDAAIAARSRSAVLQLYALESRLASTNAQLATLHRHSLSLRAERASLDAQLRAARHSLTVAQRALARRARLVYEQGSVEPLEIVFGARNLDEAMTSLDDASRLTHQGEELVTELRAAKARLDHASRDLATQEAALAAAMRAAQATAASLASARSDREAYISSLAQQHRLTEHEIASVVARARAATVRTAAVTGAAGTVASGARTAAMASGGRTITVTATGYSLGGTTSTGLPVGWGIAAVDPSVIPLGTHMSVPGYGTAVAADTGGAVGGATIDLWFPSAAQASAWGRRTVTIVLH